MIPSPNFGISEQERTQTSQNRVYRQQKALKEGVVVNNFFKNGNYITVDDFKCSVLIPDHAPLPNNLKRETDNKKQKDKNLFLPLMITPIAALGAGLLITMCSRKSIANNLVLNLKKNGQNATKASKDAFEALPPLPMNSNFNDGQEFAIYNLIRNPTSKTIQGAIGIFAFSGAVLVMRNFVEGFKDIWVQKCNADIQRDLQEKLIDVETRSFSGKYQILRNMLSTKAADLKNVVESPSGEQNNLFVNFTNNKKQVLFKSNGKKDEKKSDKHWLYLAAGVATLGISCFFGVKMFKN
jgi:hypothetical protein